MQRHGGLQLVFERAGPREPRRRGVTLAADLRGAPHQIVVASKNLKTAVLNSGQSAQLTIAEPGSYDYVCGIHGSMKGKIVVK